MNYTVLEASFKGEFEESPVRIIKLSKKLNLGAPVSDLREFQFLPDTNVFEKV